MTADQLAHKLGISRALLFKIRKRYPQGEYPANFDDVEAWRSFITKAQTPFHSPTRLPEAKRPGRPIGWKEIPSATESNVIFVAARAKEKVANAEIREIELAATRRQIIRQEEVVALFSKLATVVRGRLMKMRNDLPSALLGLDAPAIDKVLAEKMEEALTPLVIPEDFFSPRGLV
jgi:hypothetical protein